LRKIVEGEKSVPNPVSRFVGKAFFKCTGWTYDTPTDLLEDK
jgi:hypothetical protein